MPFDTRLEVEINNPMMLLLLSLQTVGTELGTMASKEPLSLSSLWSRRPRRRGVAVLCVAVARQ